MKMLPGIPGRGGVAEGTISCGIEAAGSSASFRLPVPQIRKACYYAPFQKHAINPSLDLWPEGYNQCHPLAVDSLRHLKRGGMFLIALLEDGDYLAVLPLVSSHLMCSLRGDGEGLILDATHWGTAGLPGGNVPLVVWARASHPYECSSRVWQIAAGLTGIEEHLTLRREKTFPQAFRYLGWCTWEEFKWNIDEATLVNAVTRLAASEVPVRWVLFDDGHVDEEVRIVGPDSPSQNGEVPEDEASRRLVSLDVNRRRFPNGWKPVVEAARRCGFEWLGVWLNFNGYWGGISANNALGTLNASLASLGSGTLQPRPDPESAGAFYSALIEAQSTAGFDFVKVDNQAKNITFYQSRVPNAVLGSSCNHIALEEAVNEHLDGMINCMAHNNLCAFHTKFSQVTRCSEDYKKRDLWRAKHHLSNSFANMLWMRATVWGDHDMFHSNDEVAGGVMARSKAVSGGPVYLSDAPDRILPESVWPLCFHDGRILRPLEPAVPAPESIFLDSYESAQAFRVLAPMSRHAAVVVAYNITSPEIPVYGSVTRRDHLDAMLLLPDPDAFDGDLVAYRWHDGSARKLTGDETWEFGIPEFADELFWLVEVREGWSVLGLADKFIGPTAVENINCSREAAEFTLEETGPVLIWLDSGKPQDETCPSILRKSEHLWLLEYPVGRKCRMTVRRV